MLLGPRALVRVRPLVSYSYLLAARHCVEEVAA
jgi:hypothetical protein